MFRSINKIYYRGVQGVVLVFDISKRESFSALDEWVNEFAFK